MQLSRGSVSQGLQECSLGGGEDGARGITYSAGEVVDGIRARA